MTTIAVEDTRLVEPDELKVMLVDAIRRIPVGMCEADESTFELIGFTTPDDSPITAKGDGRIEASLCGMESAECHVEFEVIGHDPHQSTGVRPAEIYLRVANERLAE